MKDKWSKIWKKFNAWSVTSGLVAWDTKRRKLTQLIRAEFPHVNTRKLWAYYNQESSRRCSKCVCYSWTVQQNIIKKAVAAQGRR